MAREVKHEHFLIRAEGLSGRPADAYVAQVQGMVRALDRFKSAFVLTTACRAHTVWTLIRPYDGAHGQCNAWGGGNKSGGGSAIGAQVDFTPGTFQQSACATNGNAGNTPMEILVHELVHAVRTLTGNFGKNASLAEEEEFAILFTNIFASEINLTKMREKHANFWAVPESAAIYNERYYRDNFGTVEKFNLQNPTLARSLARIDVPFNPLRLLYQRKNLAVV